CTIIKCHHISQTYNQIQFNTLFKKIKMNGLVK
ncbi:hypothetical protein ACUXAM_002079, partial [Staphylococcus epidermidis]